MTSARELQQALADLGHYTGAIDGKYGLATEAAVTAFQRASGLAPDGDAGPVTERALWPDREPALRHLDRSLPEMPEKGLAHPPRSAMSKRIVTRNGIDEAELRATIRAMRDAAGEPPRTAAVARQMGVKVAVLRDALVAFGIGDGLTVD